MHWAWISLNIGALMVLGFLIIVFMFGDNKNIIEQSRILRDVTLNDTNPYLNHIFKVSNTNKPLAIALYSGPTYYRESADTDLRIAIMDSNKTLFEKVFTNTFYSTVQFNKTGLYTFTVNRISNDNDIMLSALIGHFSPDSYFLDHVASISSVGLLLVGGAMSAIGVIGTTAIWTRRLLTCIKRNI